MKKLALVLTMGAVIAGIAGMALAAEKIVLKDFEGKFVAKEMALRVEGAPEEAKDYCGAYCGPASQSTVEIVKDKGVQGEQALHIYYDKSDWAGTGFDLGNLITADFKSFRFSYKGSGDGVQVPGPVHGQRR